MKKKFKFNIVDLAVIVVIIGVIAFVGLKLSGGLVEGAKDIHEFEFTFHIYEMPDFVKDYIKKDAEVCDASNNDVFGNVVSFEFGEAEMYELSSQGIIVKGTKPDHSSMDLVVQGKGEQVPSGVKLEKGVYGVGHSITIKAGNAKVFGKISGIKQLD